MFLAAPIYGFFTTRELNGSYLDRIIISIYSNQLKSRKNIIESWSPFSRPDKFRLNRSAVASLSGQLWKGRKFFSIHLYSWANSAAAASSVDVVAPSWIDFIMRRAAAAAVAGSMLLRHLDLLLRQELGWMALVMRSVGATLAAELANGFVHRSWSVDTESDDSHATRTEDKKGEGPFHRLSIIISSLFNYDHNISACFIYRELTHILPSCSELRRRMSSLISHIL